MQEKIAHLIERFPGRESVIRALSQSNPRFQDLLVDHYEAHRRLSALRAEDSPQRMQQLESRIQDLEQELMHLMHAEQ